MKKRIRLIQRLMFFGGVAAITLWMLVGCSQVPVNSQETVPVVLVSVSPRTAGDQSAIAESSNAQVQNQQTASPQETSPEVEKDSASGDHVVPKVQPETVDILMPSLPASAVSSDPIERGQASWYGKRFHGRRTASGERFDMHALTAAHPTLPFGRLVCVRGVHTGMTVLVRINDRGPHTRGRIIDLSYAAAKALNLMDKGIKEVEVFYPAAQDEKALQGQPHDRLRTHHSHAVCSQS